ncbi:MAG: DUF4954 family protein [Planctomycetota bacterium]|jgi:hypothetical protein
MTSDIRPLSQAEIAQLQNQGCSSSDWNSIRVAQKFNPERVKAVQFSGNIEIGVLEKMITFSGGLSMPSSISNTKIHNCIIGNNVYINNVSNYIANYTIEDDVVIDNVNLLAVEDESTFGNGTEASVLNEAGGRELPIYEDLTAQIAYVLALYRHREKMIDNIRKMISQYVGSVTSSCGLIAAGAKIINSGSLKNVKVGPCAVIEGAARLENGTIKSRCEAPVYIGEGVVAEDFIICSGVKITDATIISKSFVGQATVLGRQFSAENSAFFANCEGFHGEACSLFAGPYSVSHHKSTLLIAIMCSFYNAGSGSNQSNHMYKLGPVHQGILERGSKTGSFSYLFWPARVGAFSIVIGKHYATFDTSQMPFSYILESEGKSVLAPAVNLGTVGTVRDAAKWPKRDKRKDPNKSDLINFKALALNPFTVEKMTAARQILLNLQANCDKDADYVTYGQLYLNRSSLQKGIDYYQIGIDKYLGDCLVERLQNKAVESLEQLRGVLAADTNLEEGKWLDVFGLLVPEGALEEILKAVEEGVVNSVEQLAQKFQSVYELYPAYEWAWVVKNLERILGKNIDQVSGDDIAGLIARWKDAVGKLNGLILKDAQKEFSDFSMFGYGHDGNQQVKEADFHMVRGSYEDNSFVVGLEKDTVEKEKLADELIAKIARCS